MNIRKQLVTSRTRTSAGANPVTSITVHQTGNTNKGANAAAHANLQTKGNTAQASWHYTVDCKEIVQSFPDSVRCWHAGTAAGNNNSVSIELCVNSDGDYNQTIAHGAWLVGHLLARHNLPVSAVKQHNAWSGKNCPAQIRAAKNGISWAKFLNLVAGGTAPAPVPQTSAQGQATVLAKGSKGPAVKVLQAGLTRVFPTYATLAADGDFGPKTDAAVKEFQRRTALQVDGLVGPKTQAELAKYGIRL